MDMIIKEEIRDVFLYITKGIEDVLSKPYLKTAIVSHMTVLLPHITMDDVREEVDGIYAQWREYEEESLQNLP